MKAADIVKDERATGGEKFSSGLGPDKMTEWKKNDRFF